uniref:auxin-responsive protein SAUR50-like n=1 Tax=Erigeron canadensis TaxID=72917 RepID=UPI001CB9D44D|nr:auxin-responsive protein SAUR50-like [Erigeron canadensis]
MMQVKILKAWPRRRQPNNGGVSCETWCSWKLSSSMHKDEDEDYIPRDVPKGHLVVYVGENKSRFVINVKLLKNPMFIELLDQAREEYDFTTDCQLYIPCHEYVFLSVIHCARD